MMKSFSTMLIPLLFAALFSFSWAAALPHENFLVCLSRRAKDSYSIVQVVYTPSDPLYPSVLEARIRNLRWNSTDTPKPLAIVTPLDASHIQATIYCSKKNGLQIRIRSGGHDYEGISFVSPVPFVVLDMVNLRSVDVDVNNRVAWVQTGAIHGELYYEIARNSRTLAFPSGVFHTVCLGGILSGGGFGLLFRKYGTGGDNVIDAQLIDAKGRILNRKSMGEDLFWAIRGGGGGSFGVVLAWKINLVPVPATVTSFTIRRTIQQNALELVYRWQTVGQQLPDEFYSFVALRGINSTQGGRTVQAMFRVMFQGPVDQLLSIMQQRFPELGLTRQDCTEMSWLEAHVYFNDIQNQTVEVLLNRTFTSASLTPFSKIMSDYVKQPISRAGLNGLFSRLMEEDAALSSLLFFPYGGIMDRIPENATPFAHRAGNLYKIFYIVGWRDNTNSPAYLNWGRRIYSYMTPFVSKSPREAYINYRDLDIGTNDPGYTYNQARIWGRKYFKNNFDKLVRVKTIIDPKNFFRHEQSIPPYTPLRWSSSGAFAE